MKIIYSKIFYNEIDSAKIFPDYSISLNLVEYPIHCIREVMYKWLEK